MLSKLPGRGGERLGGKRERERQGSSEGESEGEQSQTNKKNGLLENVCGTMSQKSPSIIIVSSQLKIFFRYLS